MPVYNHMGLVCKDPLKIEAFYTKHFGFKRARVYAPGDGQVVMIKANDIYLELFKATEEPTSPENQGAGPMYQGWRHIAFSVENLDVFMESMGEDLVVSEGPVDMSTFIPDMRVCWIKDPEGNIIELNQGYLDEDTHP